MLPKAVVLILSLAIWLPAYADTPYRDPSNGFELVLPSRWRAVKKNEKLVKADLTSKDGRTGANIRVYKKGKTRDMTSFIQSHLVSFVSEMGARGGRTLLPLAETKSPLLTVTYRMEVGGKPTYLLKSYFWDMGDRVLWFQCGTPWSQRKGGEATLDKIARSVKLLR